MIYFNSVKQELKQPVIPIPKTVCKYDITF